MPKVLTYRLKRFWCVVLAICLLCQSGVAQSQYNIQYKPVEATADAALLSGLKTRFTSKIQSTEYLARLPALLQAKGFIAASIDSVEANDAQTIVHLYLGKAFTNGYIKVKEADRHYVEQGSFNFASNNYLKLPEYFRLQDKLLDHFENNGYPFARIQLDSLQVNDREIIGTLSIDKGLFYRVDSIRLQGPAKLSRNFIHRYLNIERGSAYSQERFALINQRLLELPYIQQAQPWDVTMLNTGSIVNLYLQPKKSNQVNVLAGFLPDNQQLGGGKLLFTVDANLQLQNAFGTGEHIGLLWQQIQPKSPRLNLLYQQPYVFKSPFGIDLSFDLFKRDSSFLNLNSAFGFRYMVSANNSARLSIQSRRTNVLQVDTFRIKNTRQLPDVADVSSLSLGVEYNYVNTDYRLNPRKGNDLGLMLSIGKKTIRKNNAVTQIRDPSFNYNTLYDTLQLNTYQLRVKVTAARYFMLARQSVLKTAVNAGLYQSPNYFRNELFQIGGYRLLRGFDEESIFASRYGVATLEYRFLLGLNAYFFGFTDVGWSRFNGAGSAYSNSYLGAGAGLAVETKGGIFNISYAAGKRNDLRFNLKEAKIHLGYVSVF